MTAKHWLYAFGVWVGLVALAIINGGLRNALISPRFGEHVGHLLSTLTLCAMILVVTYLFLSHLKLPYNTAALLQIGTFWLFLTVIFEFVSGHYVMGHPWERLLADYNIRRGRVWSVVLIITFIAPYICGRILLFRRK